MSPRDTFYICLGLLFLGLLLGEAWFLFRPIWGDNLFSPLEKVGLCAYPLVVWILCVFMNYLQWISGGEQAGGER